MASTRQCADRIAIEEMRANSSGLGAAAEPKDAPDDELASPGFVVVEAGPRVLYTLFDFAAIVLGVRPGVAPLT